MNPDSQIDMESVFRADAVFAGRLRELFSRNGYDDRTIPERLGGGGAISVEPRALPRLLQLTNSGEPLDTLIRLFTIGVAVERETARKHLVPISFEDWESAGILFSREGKVQSTVRIVPFWDLMVVFDPPTANRNVEARPDHVHGMGRASIDLLRATVRTPCERGLDLGTGCGVQGLLMARHAKHVVCTDVNPRALAIASFNASLNEITNVEFRPGSMFEPVSGERFDLVVANPPFAISPGSKFMFRDGGQQGDGFVEQIARQVPAYLKAGGLCQMTAQWIHPAGVPWQSRLKQWFEGGGCDAWILNKAVQSPAVYAENWISETERHDPDGYVRSWHKWMENLAQLRVDAISTGMIFIRRQKSGDGCFWVNEDVTGLGENAGADVAAGFRLRDLLTDVSSMKDLFQLRMKLGENVRVEQTLNSTPQGLRLERAVLRSRSGIFYGGEIDKGLMPLLLAIHPSKTLGEHIADFAGLCGQPLESLAGQIYPMLRDFVERGFLVPAEKPDALPA